MEPCLPHDGLTITRPPIAGTMHRLERASRVSRSGHDALSSSPCRPNTDSSVCLTVLRSSGSTREQSRRWVYLPCNGSRASR
eukprot:scaffold415_cov362-Prasinococcus_capsulatus_cf.AAC.22